MSFKEFFNSRGAGAVAGAATVVLGMGAIATLALGSSSPRPIRGGDPGLFVGNGVLDATMVTNAGANDPSRSASVGAAASAAARGAVAVSVTDAGDAHGSDAAQAGSQADISLSRSGSAEVYRTMLASPGPLENSIARLASVPRDDQSRRLAAGAIAGGVGGATAAGLIAANRPNGVANNPYAAGDVASAPGSAGSDAVRYPGDRPASSGSPAAAAERPAMGTQPVGPAAAPAPNQPAAAAPSAPSLPPSAAVPAPSATKPAPSPSPATVPGAGAPTNPPGLVTTPAPVPTDVLGEGAGHGPTPPAAGGQTPAPGSSGQPQGPGTVPPPTTSVVAPPMVVTPEPSTWLLMGSGLVALGLIARRRGARGI